MIKMTFKDGTADYSFELKNPDREMDLCIDIAQCDSRSAPVKFKITNKFGIVRIVSSDNVKTCHYTRTNAKAREREATSV